MLRLLALAAVAAAAGSDVCVPFSAVAPDCVDCAAELSQGADAEQAFAEFTSSHQSCAECIAGGALSSCTDCFSRLPSAAAEHTLEVRATERACDDWPAGPRCTREGDGVASCANNTDSTRGGNLGWGCCPDDDLDCIDVGSNNGGYRLVGPVDPSLITHDPAELSVDSPKESSGSIWVGDDNCRQRCALYGLHHNSPVCCYTIVAKYAAALRNPNDPSAKPTYILFDPGCYVKVPFNGTPQVAVLNGNNNNMRRALTCRSPLGFGYDAQGVVSSVDDNGAAAGLLRRGQRLAALNSVLVRGGENVSARIDDVLDKWAKQAQLLPMHGGYKAYTTPDDISFNAARPPTLYVTVQTQSCKQCLSRMPHQRTALACFNGSVPRAENCTRCRDELQSSPSLQCRRCRDVGEECDECYEEAFAEGAVGTPSCASCQSSMLEYFPNPCQRLSFSSQMCSKCANGSSGYASLQTPGSPCSQCMRTREPEMCTVCYNTLQPPGEDCAGCMAFAQRDASGIAACLKALPFGDSCSACMQNLASTSPSCKACQIEGHPATCYACWANVPDLSPPCAMCYSSYPNFFTGGACRGHNCIGSLGKRYLWLGFLLAAVAGAFSCVFVMVPFGPAAGKLPAVLAAVTAFVTALSYLAMTLGFGYVTPPSGRQFFYARYLEMLLSGPLQVCTICSLANCGRNTLLYCVSMSVLVTLSRMAGSVQEQELRLYLWCFSTAALAGNVFQFLVVLREVAEADKTCFHVTARVLCASWIAVEVVWMLAEGTGSIDCDHEAIAYCAIDAVSKGLVGVYVSFASRVPHTLSVGSATMDYLSGVYTRQPGDVGGYPFWGRDDRRLWMDSSGHWMFGYVRSMQSVGGKGYMVSSVRSPFTLPHHVDEWHEMGHDMGWRPVPVDVSTRVEEDDGVHAKINKIVAASPVAVADLRQHDRFVEIGNVSVSSKDRVAENTPLLAKMQKQFEDGVPLPVTVLRDDERISVSIVPVSIHKGPRKELKTSVGCTCQ
eukprot:TRINITY_DN11664_c0_g3_i1.p1 TRINITY_DN11664_c0_g3~~TRINITY_DN11664_c0_g3_i1.p1  ORF type:complete len:1005 (+),score=254.62 TRINITY_DN11664_c0_g3_i1:117-3131(+)